MNFPQSLLQTYIKIAFVSCALIAVTTTAQAQTLGISSNQVTISVPGTSFSTTATIANTGVVSAVTGVPTTGTLTTPTFSFTLQQTGAAGLNGTYSVGIILDEQSSQRRLEVFIPTVTFTFDGSGNLTGSLGAQNVKIYGRDAAGATLAQTSVASAGSVAFNGSTLSFSAADQITLIQAQGGILADITTSINNTGLSYDYTVILARTVGTNFTFQHSDATAFPAANNEFVVGAGDNAVLNTTSQKLTGTVTFAAVSGSGGGGGGGTTSTAAADNAINAEVTSLTTTLSGTPTPEQLAAVNTFVTDSIAQVAAGTASPSAVLGLIDLLNASISKQNFNTNTGTTIATVNLLRDAINALGNANLSDAEKITFAGKMAGSLNSFGTVVNNTTLDSANRKVLKRGLKSVSNALKAANTVLRGRNGLPNSLRASAVLISQAASFANKAKRQRYAYKFARVAFSTASKIQGSTNPIQKLTANSDSGFEVFRATVVNSLNPAEVIIEIEDSTPFTAQESLLNVINIPGATANYDASSGLVEIIAGDTFLPTYLVEAAITDPDILQGATIADDGTLIVVNGVLGSTYVPASRDRAGLITALEAAGISVEFEEDGSVNLVAAGGEKLSGTFGFDDVNISTLDSATAVTFTNPSGNPVDADYSIVVNYSDGSSQKIQPYVATDAFYESLDDLDVEVTTDRSTGIILGPDGIRLRPDYFVSTPTASDLTFHDANKDSLDISYRVATDFNGDGTVDLEVITASDKQIVYVLP